MSKLRVYGIALTLLCIVLWASGMDLKEAERFDHEHRVTLSQADVGMEQLHLVRYALLTAEQECR